MTAPYQPEIGQMIFGNASGLYDAGDLGRACVQEILRELGRVYWNRFQRRWNDTEAVTMGAVSYRPYYWGDCTCGYEQREWEWSEAHRHAQSCYQTDYRAMCDATPFAQQRTKAEALCAKHEIPWNDGCGSAVHCTCTHDAEWAAWRDENDHAPDCPTVLPNLAFGDVEIRWYKHARRGLTVQRPMTAADWGNWLAATLTDLQAFDDVG